MKKAASTFVFVFLLLPTFVFSQMNVVGLGEDFSVELAIKNEKGLHVYFRPDPKYDDDYRILKKLSIDLNSWTYSISEVFSKAQYSKYSSDFDFYIFKSPEGSTSYEPFKYSDRFVEMHGYKKEKSKSSKKYAIFLYDQLTEEVIEPKFDVPSSAGVRVEDIYTNEIDHNTYLLCNVYDNGESSYQIYNLEFSDDELKSSGELEIEADSYGKNMYHRLGYVGGNYYLYSRKSGESMYLSDFYITNLVTGETIPIPIETEHPYNMEVDAYPINDGILLSVVRGTNLQVYKEIVRVAIKNDGTFKQLENEPYLGNYVLLSNCDCNNKHYKFNNDHYILSSTKNELRIRKINHDGMELVKVDLKKDLIIGSIMSFTADQLVYFSGYAAGSAKRRVVTLNRGDLTFQVTDLKNQDFNFKVIDYQEDGNTKYIFARKSNGGYTLSPEIKF